MGDIMDLVIVVAYKEWDGEFYGPLKHEVVERRDLAAWHRRNRALLFVDSTVVAR